MARLCPRGTNRRLMKWVIEPGFSILVVWWLFQAGLRRPPPTAYEEDVQQDAEIEGLVQLVQQDGIMAQEAGGEALLFMDKQQRRVLHNRAARTPAPVVMEEKHRGNGLFLLADDRLAAEVEAKEEIGKYKVKPRAAAKEVGKEQGRLAAKSIYPLPIPNYEGMCRRKKWSLGPKGKQLYHVTGYSELMLSDKCTSPSCDLNVGRSPLKLNLSATPCQPESCLTVTIKTRFRYENVIRFIRTIHEAYPRLKVLVVDEEQREKYTNQSTIAMWELFVKERRELVSYVQAPAGVGYGRKLGAQLAQTKYILVVDDDYLVTQLTNISRLVEVLERTDASIVGGDTSDAFSYAGAFRVARNKTGSATDAHLAIYPNVFYELVQCYRNCFVADIVKTFFVADRLKILQHGAWDSERKFYEHEDFFLTMRKARLKVVNCKDIKIRHAPVNQYLAALRMESYDIWQKHLFQKWKFSDMYICDKDSYQDKATTCSIQRHFF